MKVRVKLGQVEVIVEDNENPMCLQSIATVCELVKELNKPTEENED